MVAACPSDNTASIEQDSFWDGNWDAHKIGWLISGAAAAVTLLLSMITIFFHGLNYHKPKQQRQIIRILLFAPVFAIISFFSYRFFRSYTYYELVEVVWEAFAIAAFLILMLNYIGEDEESQIKIFAEKDKKKLPLPFCCFRYRPSKAYFLVLVKWSVVQYCFVRPALSIAGIITEYYNVLCESTYSYQYAYVYITAVDFTSISIALYGLIVLYGLIRHDLKGRRPLAKFLTIKGSIFLTFYQGFIFSVLQNHGVIKSTEYWTATNVADGLNALCTSLEMVIVAAFQIWAFHWGEYREEGRAKAATEAGVILPSLDDENYKLTAGEDLDPKQSKKRDKEQRKALKKELRKYPVKHTNPLYALFHALWLGDLFAELWHSIRFAVDRIRGKEYTRQDARFNAVDFVGRLGQGQQQQQQQQVGNGIATGRGDWTKEGEAGQAQQQDSLEMSQRGSAATGLATATAARSQRGPYSSSTNDPERTLVDRQPNAHSKDEEYYNQSYQQPTAGSYYEQPPPTAYYRNQVPSPVGLAPAQRTEYNQGLRSLSQENGGRISPSPRSPRDSSGRFPSFHPSQSGGASGQGASTDQAISQYMASGAIPSNQQANGLHPSSATNGSYYNPSQQQYQPSQQQERSTPSNWNSHPRQQYQTGSYANGASSSEYPTAQEPVASAVPRALTPGGMTTSSSRPASWEPQAL